MQVVDKIPTIATQLKIIAAVKATRQGGDGKHDYIVWLAWWSYDVHNMYVYMQYTCMLALSIMMSML